MRLISIVLLLARTVWLQASGPASARPTHNYKRTDLGPVPFVDEVTGQCTLNACDALGRARDELYSVLHEKDKVHSQSRTLIGELQQQVTNGKAAQEVLRQALHLMEQRVRSLEQSGANSRFSAANEFVNNNQSVFLKQFPRLYLAWTLDRSPARWNKCSEG